MPQELQVLCCCSCESFQGHIVKKDKNWVCKICNQKQTMQMVYGRGSGKECRVIVQELNMRRLQLNEDTPTSKFELTKYPNTDEYLKTEENPQTSRWTEFVEFNGIADAKKSRQLVINRSVNETHENITEDLVVADIRNSKWENKIKDSEHYEESPLRLDNSAENDNRDPSKEDFQDYVCVSFKSNKTVIIEHHKDWQTSTNKRIISKSDNENVKRIKLNSPDFSASNYKESLDYNYKPATLEDKENSVTDALKDKHNIHNKSLEENQKDSKTGNLKNNIKEVSSIFESEHFNVDDLYFF